MRYNKLNMNWKHPFDLNNAELQTSEHIYYLNYSLSILYFNVRINFLKKDCKI